MISVFKLKNDNVNDNVNDTVNFKYYLKIQ